jgi:hypothetical protein
MEELAARFAEILEQVGVKVRSLTTDRVARGIRVTGLGILAATLGFSALLFLFLAIFAALEIPLTTAGAFAVFGVVLIAVGSYFWVKRVE